MLFVLGGCGLLAACSEEPRPRSVAEFIEQPIMLEAAMVRCQQNRSATRYEAECVNARQAAQQIESKLAIDRKAELEAMSERKRQALRRTQEAVSRSRRRAAEYERLQREAEYLAQFGVAMPQEDGVPVNGQEAGVLTLTEIPESSGEQQGPAGAMVPASDGGNAPSQHPAPVEDEQPTDLESVREELQRRQDESVD